VMFSAQRRIVPSSIKSTLDTRRSTFRPYPSTASCRGSRR
jgi:hypothetical protein